MKQTLNQSGESVTTISPSVGGKVLYPPPSSVSGQLPLVTISPKSASTRLTLARPRGVTSPPHAISHETRARSGEERRNGEQSGEASKRARSAVRDWIVRTEHRTSERGAQKSANMAVATAAADAAFLGHITRGNERTRQRERGRREWRAIRVHHAAFFHPVASQSSCLHTNHFVLGSG